MNSDHLAQKAHQIAVAVETVIIGKSDVIELAISALLANGHLLIEDIPGVGKTTLSKALSKALGLSFKRIQFTPDLLPSDITGSSIFNQKSLEFEVRQGPVFANIVLADEINRTTPKTQAALLECMEEKQVTIDGVSILLPKPFFVIATQNNIEMAGTYPLPEAQLDRFMARLQMGYPDKDSERRIINEQRYSQPIDQLASVTDESEIIEMQSLVREVHVATEIQDYILELVAATRSLPEVALGASTRGALALMHMSQGLAAVRGRTFVKPDDIKFLANGALAHRIIIRPEQRLRGVSATSCIDKVLGTVSVPVI